MAFSRSLAIARLSTKASAPAFITARRTLCSSWTLMTITLSSGQRDRSSCNQSRVPVSYTHLDVYKRQRMTSTSASINVCWISLIPVSYTHLDVYKRQPLSVASISDNSPFSCSILANSTIRMAFFAARPISITKPICA